MHRLLMSIVAGLAVALAGPATGCGPDSPCALPDDRFYLIRMPAGAEGPVGAIVFAHGYRGTAAGIMRNAGLGRLAAELNVALIAVKSAMPDWSLPNAPPQATDRVIDEPAYFDAVLADATARFDIDPERIVASGFSAGGMMVWTLACDRGHRFAGFVPISGTFWHPVPRGCDSPPASLIHIHGTEDRVVPLRGRAIQNTRQGVVPDALEMYRRHGGFGGSAPHSAAGLECDTSRNAGGDILAFCQFVGGHGFRAAYLAAAWSMLARAGQL